MGRRKGLRKPHPNRKEWWFQWYDKRWNRIRFSLASIIMGTEGWQAFRAAYLDVRVDAQVRIIELGTPDTMDLAARTLPSWIEKIEKSSIK
jgi:hypothetical protein